MRIINRKEKHILTKAYLKKCNNDSFNHKIQLLRNDYSNKISYKLAKMVQNR
jgi:hypothetical protein